MVYIKEIHSFMHVYICMYVRTAAQVFTMVVPLLLGVSVNLPTTDIMKNCNLYKFYTTVSK